MDLSIIIPCYNEVGNVHKLEEELLPVLRTMIGQKRVGTIATARIEIIFVDDGSNDGTLAALAKTFGRQESSGLNILTVQHEQNRGLGAALRSGFDRARGAVIVTTDADGTYRFAEIPNLIARLAPGIDMVTASPYHPQGAVDGVAAYRLLLSRGSSAIYRLLTDRRVHTYTALFRAYRRELLQTVPFYATGFLAGTELLVNALRMGYQVAEHPTVLYSRTFGVSKAKIMRTVQAHLGFQLNALLPWHPYGLVVRGSDATLYRCEDGQKRAFPTPEIFLSHGYHWQQVVQIADSDLADLVEGPPMAFRDGTLLRGSGYTVYIAEGGYKRPFAAADDFESMGYRWENILQIPDEQLDLICTGLPVALGAKYPTGTLLQGEGATVYLVRHGKRCAMPTVQVFQSWGFEWNHIVKVEEEQLAEYPLGSVVQPQKSMFQHWRALEKQSFAFVEPSSPAHSVA